MFEKVNPSHPDKIADRIAGAIVDLAYSKKANPKVACEVLIGHGNCHIINETNTHLKITEITKIVFRIMQTSNINIDYKEVKQDKHLAKNQSEEIRCGDNGIFKGCFSTNEQRTLSSLAGSIYSHFTYDGKYIYSKETDSIIICQSNLNKKSINQLKEYLKMNGFKGKLIINPLGNWTGGTNVDTGATNRKLGSDMGDAVTGGGLHGKDLSKADVTVNIYCHLAAQQHQTEIKAYCAIGDKYVTYGPMNAQIPFKKMVKVAKEYIDSIGGFEKLAEWGLLV